MPLRWTPAIKPAVAHHLNVSRQEPQPAMRCRDLFPALALNADLARRVVVHLVVATLPAGEGPPFGGLGVLQHLTECGSLNRIKRQVFVVASVAMWRSEPIRYHGLLVLMLQPVDQVFQFHAMSFPFAG